MCETTVEIKHTHNLCPDDQEPNENGNQLIRIKASIYKYLQLVKHCKTSRNCLISFFGEDLSCPSSFLFLFPKQNFLHVLALRLQSG
jgi:hypothetical protein